MSSIKSLTLSLRRGDRACDRPNVGEIPAACVTRLEELTPSTPGNVRGTVTGERVHVVLFELQLFINGCTIKRHRNKSYVAVNYVT